MTRYHEALCNEIRSFAATRPFLKQHPIKTIFFGGGTPSLYPLPQLRELFALLHETFDLSQVEECSLEVNPGGQTEAHYKTWAELGINRLSVGVQVLDDEIMTKMNRHQKSADVYVLFEQAPKYIKNLSADLIIGLPWVTEKVWKQTVTTSLSWPITHMSIYFLTVHQHTQLYHGVKAGRIKLPHDDTVLVQYEWATKKVEERGLSQYEISNFALPGHESRHNQGYWQRRSYRGFGLGAASYDGKYRFSNQKNLVNYTDTFSKPVDEATCSYHYLEELTDAQHQMEQIMLGLRQRNGLDLHGVVYLEDTPKGGSFFSACTRLIQDGYVTQHGSVLTLTRKGQIFENEVVVELCRGLEGDQAKENDSSKLKAK